MINRLNIVNLEGGKKTLAINCVTYLSFCWKMSQISTPCTNQNIKLISLCFLGVPTVACSSQPCLNGGSCSDEADGSYRCTCAGSYTGVNCGLMIGNYWLIDWLIDRSIDWSVGWSLSWLIDWLQISVKMTVMCLDKFLRAFMICDSIVSPHLCIATKGQRSRVCGKLFLSGVIPLVVNGGSIGTLTQLPRNTIFFKHIPEDAGW